MVDSTTIDSRRTISIKLTDRAEQLVKNIKTDTGMTQIAFIERLLEWYAGLPPIVQMHLRDKDGDAAGELVRLRLEAGGADSVEAAVAEIRRQLAVVENLSRARGGASGLPSKKAARPKQPGKE